MTKGNWERRAERANIEREEARERKLNKKLNNQKKIPNIEIILNYLYLNEKYDTYNDIIKVWIEDITLFDHYLCSNWLRNGDCNIKRCNLSHEYTFFGIRNIQLPHIDHNNEPLIEMKLLSEIHPDKYPLVRFIAINDTCVYDWLYPNVWMEWSTAKLQDIKSRKTLKAVNEENLNNNQDLIENNEKEQNIKENENVVNSSINHLNSINHFSNISQLLLSNIFQYCTLNDICSLSETSQFLRNIIRKDTHIRLRKKEFLDIHSKEINKKKKDEKKKKTKNSYLKKQDKKDGFARGGNC